MIFFKSPLYPLLVVNMKSRSPREENVALCTLIDFWTKYLQFKYTVDIYRSNLDLRNFAHVKKLIIGSLSNDDRDSKENGKIFNRFGLALRFVRASRFFVHFIAVVVRLRRENSQHHVLFYEVKQKELIFFLQLRPSSYVVLWPCWT